MACRRCQLSRGHDEAGACRVCGLLPGQSATAHLRSGLELAVYNVNDRERVRDTEGVSKTSGGGSIPPAPAIEDEMRKWCWWWMD